MEFSKYNCELLSDNLPQAAELSMVFNFDFFILADGFGTARA